jgi:alkanesulfonate monooxygenase SsuD/methylene tetrahydromethanopterin reductase-like flavin-dependent oxidoreductase (luciferase family)
MHVVCCGTTDAELTRRAAEARSTPDALRAAEAFAGSPAELVDRFGRLADTGATRFYLQLNGLSDLGHLDLVASEVLPQLR